MAKDPDDVVYVHEPQEGAFLAGIPARDLTQADVDRLGAGRIANAVATGLYRKATKQEAEKAAKEAEKAEAKAAEAEKGDER
jgi:Pyruvate/2-oxoacid:ferredoxin oxidoreductase gamma subunit